MDSVLVVLIVTLLVAGDYQEFCRNLKAGLCQPYVLWRCVATLSALPFYATRGRWRHMREAGEIRWFAIVGTSVVATVLWLTGLLMCLLIAVASAIGLGWPSLIVFACVVALFVAAVGKRVDTLQGRLDTP